MNIIEHVKHRLQGKIPSGKKRSGEWPSVRKAHLEKSPDCVVCGGKQKIEVHHIQPFHLNPSLELDPLNLITLCEAKKNGVNCHLLFGHIGNFNSVNTQVKVDAGTWKKKIKERP